MINFRFVHGDTGESHVCEIQLGHSELMLVRSEWGAHKVYREFRCALELLEATGNSQIIEDIEAEEQAQKIQQRAKANWELLRTRTTSIAKKELEQFREVTSQLQTVNEAKDNPMLAFQKQLDALTDAFQESQKTVQEQGRRIDELEALCAKQGEELKSQGDELKAKSPM